MTSTEAVVEDDWEYQRVQLPPGVSRVTASVQLAIQAEFTGWELANVRLYSDGTRRVWLRRRRRSRDLLTAQGVVA
ncbi:MULTISPECIES: DUF5703 family protein [Prauserella salsuginis group]|uniref:DUF5703 family protein n=1 Tax=Prauserella salsuginis TaxID=387889 RepID=A0ABW6G4P5_9PSEU|nr:MULTISPECIES: DUF5703 family protein [Prauserella salsuginis group]MCR3718112.1 hypothetical protein [Prauserella flava]MCR3732682.1 hypothetical protein [Prauserella salsuginis]